MSWIESIGEAVQYIEDNITEELSVDEIAEHVYISPFYFQKGFSMLCGLTVSDYIRQRRLTLAGSELVSTDLKVIDIALKYGYESPDSFTKAFTRFHGTTPTAIRKGDALIKSFAPLAIKFSLEGGKIMNYKIVEKEAFTVVGASKVFKYETATTDIPSFWAEHYDVGNNKYVCGMYGINIDETMGRDRFEYLIADDYVLGKEVPEGIITKTIPAFTWAVFPCKGPMPNALMEVSKEIFSQWLPNHKEYEFAAGYNIEMYSDVKDFPKGNQDENYYCEMWIPIKKK